MSQALIEQVRSLLHTVDWDPSASDGEIMQAIDWVGLRVAFERATTGPDLEPTHYNCCHAPKDQGHMFGCPNSTENKGDETNDYALCVHCGASHHMDEAHTCTDTDMIEYVCHDGEDDGGIGDATFKTDTGCGHEWKAYHHEYMAKDFKCPECGATTIEEA